VVSYFRIGFGGRAGRYAIHISPYLNGKDKNKASTEERKELSAEKVALTKS
jgi:hypothetical protein